MFDRRRLLRQAIGAVISGVVSESALSRAGTARPGVRIVVEQADAIVAFDPRTGSQTSLDEATDAIPPSDPVPATPQLAPDVPDQLGLDGTIAYWMTSLDGSATLLRMDTDAASAWWWWHLGDPPVPLALPVDLQPAVSSRGAGRWFHGAVVDATHLGAGSLRLMAVDLEDGEIVLDHKLDRRLELAATSVSEAGAVVAHLQGGNTQVDLTLIDLRHAHGPVEVMVDVGPAQTAPSGIDLRVVEADGSALAVAGLSWSLPDDPAPMVIMVSSDAGDEPVVTTVPGELIGIMPAQKK